VSCRVEIILNVNPGNLRRENAKINDSILRGSEHMVGLLAQERHQRVGDGWPAWFLQLPGSRIFVTPEQKTTESPGY
jgi:hypothetical protein